MRGKARKIGEPEGRKGESSRNEEIKEEGEERENKTDKTSSSLLFRTNRRENKSRDWYFFLPTKEL